MRRLETSLTDDVGARFGPYELVRRLGVGGTAETFESIRHGAGDFSQRVCLKVVLPFYRDNEAFIRLFQREAKLAAKLRHRNIVGVIDFGEIEGRSYIALELIDGIDLRTLLDTHDRNRLAPDLVVLFGLELAAALVHAHNPPPGSGFDGLVHRDISPSNVLISRQGEIMLTDFGVAKPKADMRRKSSEAKGKFPYMSPEQLRAEPVDARSDLFAVGVILFEALAGVRPYEGANDPATIMQILNGDHAELTDWVPDAPPKLCEIINRLIDPDPDKRLQSAAELIEELDPMAPSPKVHKRLGTLVEERMEVERSTREISSTVGKAPTDRETAPSATPAPAASITRQPPEPRRRRWLLALLALAAVGVGFFLLLRTSVEPDPGTIVDTIPEEPAQTPSTELRAEPEEPAQAPSRALPADPEEPAQAPSTGLRAEDDAVDAPAPPPRPKAVPLEPAQLDVIVIPWGDIWINGKRWGAAPMMNEALKPGRYRISAGQDRPSRTKTIRLRPGDDKTVSFDLTK